MGNPTIHPTGATVYIPEKAASGFTIFQAANEGALLIDMNGKEVHLWKGLRGFPNKVFPGGFVLGHTFNRDPQYGFQDEGDLVQIDFEGNVVWKFDKHQYIEDPGKEARWYARAHHDYQRTGSPVGYPAPDQEPQTTGGNTLILVHRDVVNEKISKHPLLDDAFIEVDWEGNIVWEWNAHEHFDELNFSDEAKKAIYEEPNRRFFGNHSGDWLHINSISLVGPNHHYDNGDERFHPDNIIWDAREANIIAITSKETGKIVWQLGPDYDTPETKHLGWIIGQHHAHIIPKGLPGEGNVLVFDNGGWGGYGAPNPNSVDGNKVAIRDHSRILEIDPITLEIVWQYTGLEAKYSVPTDSYKFYSPYISSAQRLENGNTLITEGSNGRIFEVTADHEIVWEYISAYKNERGSNMVYRAYRVPYNWVPQLETPVEVEIKPIDVKDFRVPNAAEGGAHSVAEIKEAFSYGEGALCVARYDETVAKKITT
ncbi:aryl-sulfate sulfotransferase [Solibacillus sp. FSL K6-1126]|uniref:aryl-sulfate sulfotransferase n=1 Tax=Solibacillus sp. FSL K6-1126 TaxID=2921463 RepID=UPI0030F4FCFA